MLYILCFIIAYALIIMLMSNEDADSDADYLIILGCKLIDDEPGETLLCRIERAVLYLIDNHSCKVIVSGGIIKGNSVSEAQVMEKLLIERGIDQIRIIKEEQAKDTYDNFYYSKQFIEKEKKICFCSSDYHIFRSRLMAEKNGLSTTSIKCRSPLKQLLIHLPIEEFYIIKNMIEK